MILKKLALSLLAITTISGCSLLGTKQIEVVTKPIEIEIIQPTMPREIKLGVPKWYVVSEAVITNRCNQVMKLDENGEHIVKEDGTHQLTRPKQCDLDQRENPDWPVGYTYLDRFLDDMKKANAGDVLFVATTVNDYELMSSNVQELRRYIRELGEVVVYYNDVTTPSGEKGVGAKVRKNETNNDN